jgi:hypothetical protein
LAKRANEKRYVYALVDPSEQKVAYIGQTKSPKTRMYAHTKMGNHFAGIDRKYASKLFMWLSDMVIKGVKPEMVIVEITTLEKVAEREMWWLSKFEELGIELVNGDHAERTYIGKSA